MIRTLLQAASESSHDSVATSVRPDQRFRVAVTLGACSLLGLLLAVQSFIGGHIGNLAEYDDGVYFASAIALVHGVLPYRDFTFLQPPLIAVWLAPWALISTATSARFGLELARGATDVIPLLSVLMVAKISWKRPRISFLVAVGVTALSIGTIQASQTVLLEPYLVVLCLAGLFVLDVGSDRTANSWRLIFAGALFGLAGATKVWAIIPVAVILWRMPEPTARRRLQFALGVVAGFTLGAGPFVLFAPLTAFHDIVLTQALRGPSGMVVATRVGDLSGFQLLVLLARTLRPLGEVLTVAIVGGAVWLVTQRTRASRVATVTDAHRDDTLLRTLGVTIGLILVAAPSYYYHYAAFYAPFLGLALGTLPPLWRRDSSASSKRGGLTLLSLITLGAALLIGDTVGVVRPVVENSAVPQLPVAAKGSGCVVSDTPAFEILNNSLTLGDTGCPNVIDWLGVERALVHGISGEPQDARSAAFQRDLLHWFHAAGTVVLSPIDAGIGSRAQRYLVTHFTLSRSRPDGLRIYHRRR